MFLVGIIYGSWYLVMKKGYKIYLGVSVNGGVGISNNLVREVCGGYGCIFL